MATNNKRGIHEGQAKVLIEAFLNGRISEKKLIDLIIQNAISDPNLEQIANRRNSTAAV